MKEVRIRRVQLGWWLDGQEDDVEGPMSSMQKFFVLIGTFRLQVTFHGVRVRLRSSGMGKYEDAVRCGGAASVGDHGNTIPLKTPRAVLFVNLLSFITLDLVETDIQTEDGKTLVKADKVNAVFGRSEQVVTVERIKFLQPMYSRDHCAGTIVDDRNDHIPNPMTRNASLDRISLKASGSLHALSTGGPKKGRHFVISVGHAALPIGNPEENEFVQELKNIIGTNRKKETRRKDADGELGGMEDKTQSKIQRWLDRLLSDKGRIQSPVFVEITSKKISLLLQKNGQCAHMQLNSLSFDFHSSPWQRDHDHAGRIKSSMSWDGILVGIGVSEDAPVLQLQSSASSFECNIVDLHAMPHPRSNRYDGTFCVSIQALHTKCHHERLAEFFSRHKKFRDASKKEVLPVPMEHGGPPVMKSPPLSMVLQLELGNGSSLQFVEGHDECVLHKNLEVLKLKVSTYCDTDMSDASGDMSLDVSLVVEGVAMAVAHDSMELHQVLSAQIASASFIRPKENNDKSVKLSTNEVNAVFPGFSVPKLFKIFQCLKDLPQSLSQESNTNSLDLKSKLAISMSLSMVNIGMCHSYVVDESMSSTGRTGSVATATSVHLSLLDFEKTNDGKVTLGVEGLRTLYKENTKLNLSFKEIESGSWSILAIENATMKQDKSTSCRSLSLGPTEIQADLEPIISMSYMMKSLDIGTSKLFSNKRETKERTKDGSMMKFDTSINISHICVSIPLSTDREVSVCLSAARCNIAEKFKMCSIEKGTILMKGTPILVSTVITLSTSVSEKEVDVAIVMKTMDFVVPHDRDPGPTLKFAMTYLKAGKLAMKKILGTELNSFQIQKTNDNVPGRIITLQLSMEEGQFKFEHHPIERAFSANACLVKRASLQQYLWNEAYLSVSHEFDDHVTPLHHGVRQSFSLPNDKDSNSNNSSKMHHREANSNSRKKSTSSQTPWESMMENISSHYIEDHRSQGVDSDNFAFYPDIMGVHWKKMSLVLVYNDEDHADPEAGAITKAESFVKEVDEPSKNIEFQKCTMLTVNMRSEDISVNIGGSNKPIFRGKRLLIDGPLAIAKQKCASPVMEETRVHLGAHHLICLKIPAKATVAPFKIYTKLNGSFTDAKVHFSPGFEPALSLIGLCSRRLILRDPGRSHQTKAHVPWWDDLRYFWRGTVKLTARSFDLCLAPGIEGLFTLHRGRFQLYTTQFKANLEPGLIHISTDNFRALLFRKAIKKTNGHIYVLPVVDFNNFEAYIRTAWILPGGRDGQEHHIFPNANSISVQTPIEVTKICLLSVSLIRLLNFLWFCRWKNFLRQNCLTRICIALSMLQMAWNALKCTSVVKS